MREWIIGNSYAPLLITLAAFAAGLAMQRRWKNPLFNPLLIASLLTGGCVIALDMPVDQYQAGCAPLQYLLTPATICYAISLYEQLGKLKKHLFAILAGILCGTLCSLGSIRLMCSAFGLDAALTTSLLPKSITTAIGMVISQEAGGIAALTTAAIVITGVLGNILGPLLCRLFGLHSEIAQGAALGTASHAIGTSRAAQMSDLAGAVSSLSLTLAGLITVVLFSFFI